MKKCRIILPLLAFAMLFTGCTKEIITYGSQISTYRFNVTPSQWKVNPVHWGLGSLSIATE